MSMNNRTRKQCKMAGCSNLSRAMSGMCVTHRQLPIERDLPPIKWQNGAVYRDRLAQSDVTVEAPSISKFLTDPIVVEPADNEQDLSTYALIWFVITAIIVGFLASPLGQQLLGVAR